VCFLKDHSAEEWFFEATYGKIQSEKAHRTKVRIVGGLVTRSTLNKDYSRQSVRGIFFCKTDADKDDCRKLVQDLGCTIVLENANSLTIQATRARLKELKARYMANEDDVSQISSRLKHYFERILIGGSAR
jgi:hypothetical protein